MDKSFCNIVQRGLNFTKRRCPSKGPYDNLTNIETFLVIFRMERKSQYSKDNWADYRWNNAIKYLKLILDNKFNTNKQKFEAAARSKKL